MPDATSTAAQKSNADAGAFYAENGYFLARGLFREQIPALERDYDRIIAQLEQSGEETNARWHGEAADRLGTGTVVNLTHNVHMYSATWLRIWQDPAFLDLAASFLGEDLVLHHTKLFRKPAERGAAFPMHQDWSYFPVTNDRCLAAILYLSEADDEMGCLRLYPGSQRVGRVDHQGGMGPMTEIQRRFPIEGSVALPGQPGDVIFFHSLMVHGSYPNRSQRIRKTVLAQLYSGREEIEEVRHPDSRLVLRGWNHRMTRAKADRWA